VHALRAVEKALADGDEVLAGDAELLEDGDEVCRAEPRLDADEPQHSRHVAAQLRRRLRRGRGRCSGFAVAAAEAVSVVHGGRGSGPAVDEAALDDGRLYGPGRLEAEQVGEEREGMGGVPGDG